MRSLARGLASALIIEHAAAWSIPGFHGSYNRETTWKPTQSMAQWQTNGASTLGTLAHAALPSWVNGPTPKGTPWGQMTCGNANPYTDAPYTGMTRYYDWSVTNQTMAPDGVEKAMLVVNGQFPGPLIEANWGDWISVKVCNDLPPENGEGTSIHWHGFLQTGTPYWDGVPGVVQCPIAPGQCFSSTFRAELYGTSWWHSHWSAQYIDGLVGPIVVHGPSSEPYDIDLGPVMLADWFHTYYRQLVEQVFVSSQFGSVQPPFSQNILINGKANFDCSTTELPCTPSAGLASFRFQSGKKHLLRLINHGSEGILFVSIDGYNMTVIANDFVPVVAYETDLVTLAVGQRTDVIVEAIGNPTDSVWLRVTEGPSGLLDEGFSGCDLNSPATDIETLAAIYYEDADTSIAPTTTSPINPALYLFPEACNNQDLALTVPVFPMAVNEPSYTVNIISTGGFNASGDFVWTMLSNFSNNIPQTYLADYNDPTLLEAKLGTTTFPPIQNTWNFGGGNTTVRIVMQSVGPPASHPFHLHGHNMQILSTGLGTWDGTITNPTNPQRRDVQLVGPEGYLVVQFELTNPGAWPFHCHVAWHVSQGMNSIILYGGDDVVNMPIPATLAETCRTWAAYSGTEVVQQIDSGL